MQRLVTTSQAASILGISLQGVHYRIKHNKLSSIKKSGKIFVYISSESQQVETSSEEKEDTNNSYINLLLSSKDEQILILKKSVKYLKVLHHEEIKRIELSQKKMMKIFNSKIELLKNAFSEMRSIYKIQSPNNQSKNKFITLNDFFIYMKQNFKTNKEIKLIILKAIKKKDKRFIFNKKSKKVFVLNEDFSDLL